MASGLNTIEVTKAQWRLLVALMLRDIKTRFFGHELGFLFAIGWPLSHILILIVIYSVMGRAAPYGQSVALWFATGVIPYVAFNYMSRFIMLGVVLNKPLLTYPVVKVADILFSRAIVEILSAGLVVIIVCLIFVIFDVDFIPLDVPQACLALLTMMFLGIGVGVINAIIAAAAPIWITGYALLTILMWISSGVVFVPDALPEVVRTPLSYLPQLQGIEWMRSAYYEGYGTSVLDRGYLVWFSAITLIAGLILERLVRGKLLQ